VALPAVRAAWTELFPDAPFQSIFLDDVIRQTYAAERRFRLVAGMASALAVLVACLGLFGLAAFSAQQRTKEIGVRKVLGAGVFRLVALVSQEFVVLVAIAFLIAAPLAYWAMSKWLEDFAYRISLGPATFALAGGAALVIALLTVGYHALRAATTDPVKSLRTE
jgi:putative ABC transport system permease protein